MNNPFFKNKGPFKIDKLLKLSNIDNKENFLKSKITDIRDLSTATKDNITFFHSKKYEKLASKTPLAMWVTKEVLNYSRDHSVKEGLDNVALWNAATLHKEDVMTTMMSKMQKKKPEYRNLRDKNFLKHKSSK